MTVNHIPFIGGPSFQGNHWTLPSSGFRDGVGGWDQDERSVRVQGEELQFFAQFPLGIPSAKFPGLYLQSRTVTKIDGPYCEGTLTYQGLYGASQRAIEQTGYMVRERDIRATEVINPGTGLPYEYFDIYNRDVPNVRVINLQRTGQIELFSTSALPDSLDGMKGLLVTFAPGPNPFDENAFVGAIDSQLTAIIPAGIVPRSATSEKLQYGGPLYHHSISYAIEQQFQIA